MKKPRANSDRKGKRGENALARLFRETLPQYSEIRRGLQARDGKDCCDVEGTPWWLECKVRAKVNLDAAVRQALDDNDGRPVLVCWRENRGEWQVTLRREEWVRWTCPPWQWPTHVVLGAHAGVLTVTLRLRDWLVEDAKTSARIAEMRGGEAA